MPRTGISSGLKICPECGEVYSERSTECHAHKTALLDWTEANDTGNDTGKTPPGDTGKTVVDPDPSPSPGPLHVGDLTEPEVALPAALMLEPRVPTELPDQPSRPARLLGDRYRLGKLLGVGGYGAVFAAFDQRLGKRVAVKLLSPTLTQDEEVCRRFEREAIAASRVRHECVVDVTDFDVDPAGTSFFVMEYLDGSDLSEVLEDDGPLAISRALAIAAQCASALTATHEKGILHRDLKPANIFLVRSPSRPDFVKIIDFGISKVTNADSDYSDLTSASKVVGTPHYMPPEQARGQPLDGRTDLYALGVILFEMLTDRRPFTGASALEILNNAATQRRVPPSTLRPEIAEVPGLDALVLRAIAIDRDKRYASMEAFGEAIVACLTTIDPALVHGLPAIANAPQTADEVLGPGNVSDVVAANAPATLEASSGEVTRSYQAVAARGWLRAGVVAVVAVAALAVFWVRRDGGSDTSPGEENASSFVAEGDAPPPSSGEPTDYAAALPNAVAPVDARAAEPIAIDAAGQGAFTFRLTSSPPEATVESRRRGRLGITPLDVTLPADQVDDELVLSHSGRADETVHVDRETDSELEVLLEPERTVKSRARRKRTTGSTKPAARKEPTKSGIGIKDW